MEIELRKYLPALSDARFGASADKNLKEHASQKIIENEDVLFHWDIVSVNWCTAVASELLKVILVQYITVRGFSFAKSFMEKYKQSAKKTTQKSKGLRKTLDTSNVCHDV